jgi:cytochrome c oxidase cbb3-type subunit I/II
LFRDQIDFKILNKKLSVMKGLGVPYYDVEVENAEAHARRDASRIAASLAADGVPQSTENKEIVALIAYMQRLGRDFKEGVVK